MRRVRAFLLFLCDELPERAVNAGISVGSGRLKTAGNGHGNHCGDSGQIGKVTLRRVLCAEFCTDSKWYYLEYRLLALSVLDDAMTMADGDSIYVETTPSVPLYAQMMMTEKMVDIEGAHDSLMEITFSKYTAGRPAIYISAVDARPDALHRQYALIEGTTPSLLNGSLPSFGITIDLKTVRWPDGNAPFGRHEGNDSALLDDDVAIDGWTGLLYLGIDCVEGDSVALDVEAKFMAKEAVSRISYGVPAY